jgi:hypothetical protein
MPRSNLTAAREFGRFLEPVNNLQPADGIAAPDDVLIILDVSEVSAAGQPKKITISGLADAIGSSVPRAITIASPQADDSFTIFKTAASTTLTSVIGLVTGSTPSVTYEVRYDADRSSVGTLAIVPDTVTNSSTGDAATVQNQPIPAGSYVWVVVTAVSGTVEELNLTISF